MYIACVAQHYKSCNISQHLQHGRQEMSIILTFAIVINLAVLTYVLYICWPTLHILQRWPTLCSIMTFTVLFWIALYIIF